MRHIPLVLLALLPPSLAAAADCQPGIAAAMRRANALPPSAGRAAMLEQIQRADIARHEDDQADCAEQLKTATEVLDRIDAAKARAAATAPGTPAASAAAPPPGTPDNAASGKDGSGADARKSDAPKP